MRNLLIAAIAGLSVCFAGNFTSQAQANPWNRTFRQLQRQGQRYYRQNQRFYRSPRYYNQYNRYYTPRRYYYTPRYRYGYGYRNYGWNRGGVWIRF